MNIEEIRALMFTEVEVRNGPDKPWRRGVLAGYEPDDAYCFRVRGAWWPSCRAIPKAKRRPFDQLTAPKVLEVVGKDGSLGLCVSKDHIGAYFITSDSRVCIPWVDLMDLPQSDGAPCYIEEPAQ